MISTIVRKVRIDGKIDRVFFVAFSYTFWHYMAIKCQKVCLFYLVNIWLTFRNLANVIGKLRYSSETNYSIILLKMQLSFTYKTYLDKGHLFGIFVLRYFANYNSKSGNSMQSTVHPIYAKMSLWFCTKTLQRNACVIECSITWKKLIFRETI